MKHITTILFSFFILFSSTIYSQEIDAQQGEKTTQDKQTSFSESEPGIPSDSEDRDEDCNMFFPNTFTPNGDNLNDVFKVYTNCVPQNFNVRIYTRWGEKLYESNNPNFEWDGKRNGKVSQSVFVYIVDYSESNRKRNVSGTITVLP